jgi:hypothetical protein
LPFKDSRRLPVGNRYFGSAGVALDVIRIDMDDALVADWRRNVRRARAHLGWDPDAACVASDGLDGMSLAIVAPPHRLRTAMEINEWALCAALRERDPMHWCGLRDALRTLVHRDGATPAGSLPAEIDAVAALARFAHLDVAEGAPLAAAP